MDFHDAVSDAFKAGINDSLSGIDRAADDIVRMVCRRGHFALTDAQRREVLRSYREGSR